MATNYLKPQSPLKKIDKETGDINYLYIMTTPDQIVMEDGSRLNANLIYYSDGGEDAEASSLSEAEKAEIVADVVAEVTADGIPEYWQTHLDEKIETVKALQNEGGKDCFSFVFMTDIHYPSNLGKISPKLAKKILDECNIKFVLNGGDSQTRGCYHTKDEILLENKQLKEMFSSIKDKVLQIEGNHDGSYYWSDGTVGSGTAYMKQLTEQEMFEEYYRANGLNCNVNFDENSNAFYVDDVSNKVRYIGLNSMNVPNEITDVNIDGTAKYVKFHSYQFLQSQYDFLCNEALATVPNDAWSVVVFGHSGIYNAGDYAVMVDVLSAYKDKTNCVSEYAGTAGATENFTNLLDQNAEGFYQGYLNPDDEETVETDLSKKRYFTNYIPVTFNKTTPNVVRIGNANGQVFAVKLYDSNYTALTAYPNWVYTVNNQADFIYDADGIMSWNAGQFGNYMSTTNCGALAYVRFYLFEQADGEIIDVDIDNVAITVNEEITYSEGGGNGYDAVSVNHDFTDAKGEFVAYFHGHDHKDADYTRDSIKDISTRCDAREEHTEVLQAERVKGTITEQSFDVFTVNRKTNKIYATKIGAGSDREINY